MSFSPAEDFKTEAELANQTQEILERVRRTGQPIAITKDGKPGVILLEASRYEWLLHLLNLSRMLHEAEADVRAGRVQPVEEFFEELDREQQASDHHHRARQG